MSQPPGILYSPFHSFIYKENDLYVIGASDKLIEQTGKIIEVCLLTKMYDYIMKGEIFAAIESEKAATEIYMPLSGNIKAVNSEILEHPEILNGSEQKNKWFVKLEATTLEADLSDLTAEEQNFETEPV